MVEVEIDSQLRITDLAWNESLSDPYSQIYIDLKDQLEFDLTVTFCKESHCQIEVAGFSEGSVIGT